MGQLDRLGLVTMQAERRPLQILLIFTPAKNRAAISMQQPLGHQLIDRLAGLEEGIQLNQRLRPEHISLEKLFIDILMHTGIANLDKTLNIGGIIVNQMLAQVKNIHRIKASWKSQ